MKPIVKSLVLAPAVKKWTDYQTHFMPVFEGRDASYDRVIALIDDFFKRFAAVPTQEAIVRELVTSNDNAALEYLNRIVADPGVPVHEDDTVFNAAADAWKMHGFDNDVAEAQRRFQSSIAGGQAIGVQDRRDAYSKLMGDLSTAKHRLDWTESGTKLMMYGETAVARLRDRYQNILVRNAANEAAYYTFPFLPPDVSLKGGDLVFVGAYTSQGKSVMLRAISYHMAVTYGRNVEFLTFEMTAETVETMFAILHANNRAIFPEYSGPPISYDDWRFGLLTEEQLDFLFNVAQPDLTGNKRYGTIHVRKPGRVDFNLGDLVQVVAEAESVFPLHVLAIDYITLMNPLAHDSKARSFDKQDMNQMIAAFKQLLLNHHSRSGAEAPILGLTAAQISRSLYDECVKKRDGIYDARAFSDYNEIERSADVALTMLMTEEMQAEGIVHAQAVKNREGARPLIPLRLYIALRHGFALSPLPTVTAAQTAERIQSLEI